MARLIVDTPILIDAERAGTGVAELVDDDDDVAIAAVTAAELLVGVELASKSGRARRARFVEQILTSLRIEPYDLTTARVHAALLAHTRHTGRPRGAHDLLIAATAINSDREVLTADLAGFSDLPGLRIRG